MNEFSVRLNEHYSIVSKRLASADTVGLQQIKTMVEHGMSAEAIARNVFLFAERVSLLDRMLLLADLKGELLKLLKKGERDENVKSACLRLGWELADFMPGSAPYEKQIAIGENYQAVRPDDPTDEIGPTE